MEIEFGVTKLPKYDVPDGYTSWEYLNKLCFDGLKERYPDGDHSLKERLEYELSVIQSMGYVDYFLDRVGFYQLCKNTGNQGRTGTRFGGRKYRIVLSGNHKY